ncbi:hemolysin family protein [Kibdelosporangium persicum]|uniref:Magnesium and cobalt efflux protein CorC n=1 Tax=Kibdelosporangium persicum TaxID=2698649 RepID=A0ABX2F6Y2_9PSEU|nr:hemolysin family protein [Kibdelosporangium persicum]NRN67121.1 Magnesium and cobalt efflux protein CorC [Kibdelosporangium persicum]
MSGLSTWVAVMISVGAVALSAFFVAVEFALVAARQYRLEEAAESSLPARAALRSSRELSLLLAGSQLGITLCTLVLGAVTKPAVHNMMTPLLHSWNLPDVTAEVIAFILSLIVVTFVHLVVGEMAPKSWAIAHPEFSATLLALPMRGFMWLTRPLLVALNNIANWCLRRFGVEPVDEVSTGRSADDLRQLLDHSARAGALDDSRHEQLATALELNSRPLREIVRAEVASVPPDVSCARIKAVARSSGHLRLVVLADGQPVGVVHVRDALLRPPSTTAESLMRPVLTLDAQTPIYAALSTMRETRNHLAVVQADGAMTGLVTLDDVLNQLLPVT